MGAQRQCSGSGDAQGCGRKAYPRTDPVVIVSVVDEQEGKLLLGRGARFPPGFFSCLAGFVEPCESVEAAAAREVFEETGLALDRKSIAVEQSQPWPIGRALSCELMVGMRARTAVAGASLDLSLLSLQEEEVAEVKWVTRDECKQALLASTKKGSSSGQLLGPNKAEGLDWFVPGPYAIAHHLIASFAAEGDKEGDSSGACGEGVGVQQQSEADGHRNSGPKL
jgi:NAD+ diphosphatase